MIVQGYVQGDLGAVNCAVGMTEVFEVKKGLHQKSA